MQPTTTPLELREIRQKIQNRRRQLDARIGEARALAKRGKALEVQTTRLAEQIQTYDKAILLLNTIGEERQNAAHRQIESLVTNGLQTIFGQTLSFHLVQSDKDKGRRSEVDFVVRSTLAGGKIIDTPVMGARGGGLAAVVGVLLRIVILLLDHKDTDTPLILDEPFAHLSSRYTVPMAEFLKELVEKTHIQIIMVTHQPEFASYADKIYEFTLVDGETKVKELGLSDV